MLYRHDQYHQLAVLCSRLTLYRALSNSDNLKLYLKREINSTKYKPYPLTFWRNSRGLSFFEPGVADCLASTCAIRNEILCVRFLVLKLFDASSDEPGSGNRLILIDEFEACSSS